MKKRITLIISVALSIVTCTVASMPISSFSTSNYLEHLILLLGAFSLALIIGALACDDRQKQLDQKTEKDDNK